MNQRTVILVLLLAFFTSQFTIVQNTQQFEELNKFLRYIVLQTAQTGTDWSLLDPDNQLNPVQVDTIYYNGTILTMNEKNEIAQMLSTKKGKIGWAGPITEVLKRSRINLSKLKVIDLEGKTMMPGFYDAHSHITIHSIKKDAGLNLASPPFGNITSIDELKRKIKEHIIKNNINSNTVIHGSSYSELGLIDRRHPNRFDLDEVSKDHIIILQHVSGHIAITNSKAIESMNIRFDTPDPSGGKIERIQEGPLKGEPTGLFAERAKTIYIDPYNKKLENNQQSQKIIISGVQDYIESGVTTAQQGFITDSLMDLLLSMKDKLKIDIRGYLPCLGNYLPIFDKYQHLKTNRFQLQGFKVFTDGSIQGYTGYLTDPYYIQPTNTNTNDNQGQEMSKSYRGFPTFQQQDINKIVEISLKRNIDVIAHTNGDAAIDIYIKAVKQGKSKFPLTTSRVTAVHAQNARDDQLDQMKKTNIIPSFFVGHTYYWGDQHRNKFLGPKRAEKISPANSALKKGINFTLHNDAPVTPITENGIFMIVWCAVNRITFSGKVLGPEERISVIEALKSVTIRAAYQGSEEASKGSIQSGKIADLIVLSDNPLTIDPLKLKNIQVLKTIKEGTIIYKRK